MRWGGMRWGGMRWGGMRWGGARGGPARVTGAVLEVSMAAAAVGVTAGARETHER